MVRPLVYTTAQRIEQYNTVRAAGLSRPDYRDAIKTLNKAENKYRTAQKLKEKKKAQADKEKQEKANALAKIRDAKAAEAEKKKKEEKNAKRRDKRKAKAGEKKEERAITPDTIYDAEVVQPPFGETLEVVHVYGMYKLLKDGGEGPSYRFLVNSRGRTKQREDGDRDVIPNIDTTVKFYKNYRKFLSQFIVGGYEGLMFEEGDRIVLLRPTPISAERLFQYFAEGISHCVFTPLYKKFSDLIGKTTSKETLRKYVRYVRDLKVLEEKYKTGVPENCMEMVAKTAHMKIPFYDILGLQTTVFNENGRTAVVSLQNTRFNHVDEGNLVLNSDAEIVSQHQINTIWRNCHKRNEFYDVLGSIKNDNIRKIKTLTKIYQVEDNVNDIFNEFSSSIKLNDYKFNNTKYPQVRAFIKAGCVVNSMPVKVNEGVATGHIDMPKAYTQFKQCPTYSGFLGVIHQWARANFTVEFITSHIGIYKFKVLSGTNALLNKMGITDGSEHILPSVEILYFVSQGVSVQITEGVFGARFDFEFPEYMLIKDDGLPRYSKWSGKLAMEILEHKHTIKCSPEYAKIIKCDYPNLDYWADKGVATITIPVKGSSTATHILAFITSYARINMYEEMKKFDINNILTVVLDGILYKGPKPATWLVDKPVKEYNYHGNSWYDQYETLPNITNELKIINNTLLTGQGGCGKTYGVLTAGNFNMPLYVVPTHVLGQKGNKAYNCKYLTIHKLIGIDCVAYSTDHSTPPVILVDELTQYPAEWIDKVFLLYPNSLIILAGDVISSGQWFQCRSGTPGKFAKIWKPVNVDIINITGDRRAKDEELKALKLTIRDMMMNIFTNGDSGECDVIKNWAKQILPTVSYGEAITNFQTGDIWLASTHRVNNALLAAGVCSGYYKEGGSISDVEQPGFKKRGSFTIHSIQGVTLENRKIFISVDDLFEYSMLYTGVSRAVNMEQLVFVC